MTAKKKSTGSKKQSQRKATNRTRTEPPRGSVAEHSEHPESRGDSTVRHTRPGFPQGEGDVTRPAKAGNKKQSIRDTLLEQHAATSSGDTDTVLELTKHKNANRLSTQERELAIELLPTGAILEHEAPYRWRVHITGQNRYGFGATAKEAIDSWVLGNSDVNGAQAAARRFSELSSTQQQEITDRDNAAARSVGQGAGESPDVVARRQALEFSQAADKRAKTPLNANSDGAEVSTATNRQGRGEDPSVPAGTEDRKASAQRSRSGARRRTGAKARK